MRVRLEGRSTFSRPAHKMIIPCKVHVPNTRTRKRGSVENQVTLSFTFVLSGAEKGATVREDRAGDCRVKHVGACYALLTFFRFEWLHLRKFPLEGAAKARTGGLAARRAF